MFSTLRFALHVLRCWRHQLAQSEAERDIRHASHVLSDARDRQRRAIARECEEKLAFQQWRRIVNMRRARS